MATYVCPDLHGQYDLFLKLLDKIKFSPNDTLYILGDIIDKGSKSLALLNYVRQQSNIHCILGNHEHAFLQYYNSIMRANEEYFDEQKTLADLQRYFPLDDFKLTWDIVDYIERLPYYMKLIILLAFMPD